LVGVTPESRLTGNFPAAPPRTPHEEELRLVKDAGRLAKLGRRRSRPLRADAPHRGDGSGANMLGRILMEVRSELRA